MVRRNSAQSVLSAGHAREIVERALAEGKLAAADIRRYTDSMRREIEELEERLTRLTDAAGKPGEVIAKDIRRRARRAVRRSRRAVTPERMASQKLQGQYLGFLRQIPERQRNRFKKLAVAEGRQKAVGAMKKVLGK